MDTRIQGPIPLSGPHGIADRQAGKQKRSDPETFRRALEEESSGKDDKSETGGKPAAIPVAERPLRRGLQQLPLPGRKEQGSTAHHVDVLA